MEYVRWDFNAAITTKRWVTEYETKELTRSKFVGQPLMLEVFN
jgi:hypothetical protein